MTHYTLNQEHNGIEISFDYKPVPAVLTALKKAGYRWHNTKKVWYAKQTAERLKIAEAIVNGQDIPAIDKTDNQAELKALYKELISKYWKDPKMIDHCIKNNAYIVPLENGDIYDIDKPSIETDFCFGYGMNGVSYEGDYEEASEAMHTAERDTDYFISENMKHLDGYIEALKDKDIRVFKYVHYCGDCDSRLKDIGFYRYYQEPATNLKDCHELTETEREAVLAGYEEVKRQFKKRLDTYLKKYGLSKLHTWTYLRD